MCVCVCVCVCVYVCVYSVYLYVCVWVYPRMSGHPLSYLLFLLRRWLVFWRRGDRRQGVPWACTRCKECGKECSIKRGQETRGALGLDQV